MNSFEQPEMAGRSQDRPEAGLVGEPRITFPMLVLQYLEQRREFEMPGTTIQHITDQILNLRGDHSPEKRQSVEETLRLTISDFRRRNLIQVDNETVEINGLGSLMARSVRTLKDVHDLVLAERQ